MDKPKTTPKKNCVYCTISNTHYAMNNPDADKVITYAEKAIQESRYFAGVNDSQAHNPRLAKAFIHFEARLALAVIDFREEVGNATR